MKRLYFLLLLVCLYVLPAGATGSFVQVKATVCNFGGSSSGTCNFDSSVATGNWGAVYIHYTSASTVSGVTMTCGTTTILDTASNVTSVLLQITSSGACSITVTLSATSTVFRVRMAEITGVTGLDVHAIQHQTNPGTGTDACTSGTVTATGADFVVGIGDDSGGNGITWTAGTGFTLSGGSALITYEGKSVSAGSTAATFTITPGVSAPTTAVLAFSTVFSVSRGAPVVL